MKGSLPLLLANRPDPAGVFVSSESAGRKQTLELGFKAETELYRCQAWKRSLLSQHGVCLHSLPCQYKEKNPRITRNLLQGGWFDFQALAGRWDPIQGPVEHLQLGLVGLLEPGEL